MKTLYLSLLLFSLMATTAVQAQTDLCVVGAAAVDITPQQFPVNMPGGFSRNVATSAHDRLFARSIYVTNGGLGSVSLTVVDNLGVDPAIIKEAKIAASKQIGLPVEKMMVCSTHSHSCPASNPSGGTEAEKAYTAVIRDGITKSIVEAFNNRRGGSFGFASHPLPDEVFNRRWFLQPGKMPVNPFGKMDLVKMNPSRSPGVLDRPAGPTDPDITVLSFRDFDRKPIALFANYSLHYVGAIPAGQVSADYFGEFARLMPTRMRAGKNFVAMMSNGTSGDINNIPFNTVRAPRERFEQVRIVARKAADTAWTATQKIENYTPTIAVDMRQRTLTLKYRKPTDEELERARRIVALTDPDEIKKLPRLAVPYAKRTIAAAERDSETVDVILQTIRIDDLGICAIPFETLVEIGLDLKRESPFNQTMVIGLANGRYGYLPPPNQHRLGGYETWLGTNIVQKDASVIIQKTLLEMLTEMK